MHARPRASITTLFVASPALAPEFFSSFQPRSSADACQKHLNILYALSIGEVLLAWRSNILNILANMSECDLCELCTIK